MGFSLFMRRAFLLLFILAAGNFVSSAGEIAIIPQPNEMRVADGNFIFDKSTKISVSPRLNKETVTSVKLFVDQLNLVSGFSLKSVALKGTTTAGVIIDFDNTISEEGYKLDITDNAITIKASSNKGVNFALQSVKQLLPLDIFGTTKVAATWSVPCVTITDSPRFGYRGMHIDVARHFFDVKEMKRIIDVLAIHKLNTLHWHLTDDQGWRIEIKKYPKLTTIGSIRNKTMIAKEWENYDTTPYGGFYTQEQIKDVVKYAADRCITIIPEIDLPGHMMAALAAYPEMGCTGGPYEVSGQWGVRDDVLCPGKPMTMQFIKDVLAEVMTLFPSKYIHIGGDETPKIRWEKCPDCQKVIAEKNIKGDKKHSAEFFLQSYLTEEVEAFVNEHGRRIIGWDEILEGKLAPNATVMSWRGVEGGIEAAKLGHDVIMTPSSPFYFDHYATLNTKPEPLAIGGFNSLDKVYNFDPVPAVLTPEQRKHILGPQANLWTEYIPSNEQLEYMLLPRLAALSEVQWTQLDNKDWKRFLHKISHTLSIYDKLGMNYAKHIYDITAKYNVPASNGVTMVSLETQGNTPIYYTLDGTEPTTASTLYTAPIAINKSCTLKANAKRENAKTSTFATTFSFNKATGHKAVLHSAPTEKYTFNGASILTDGLYGDFNYSTGYWLGFLNEPLDVEIDLGTAKEISSVKVNYMIQLGEWVFPPRKITVLTSNGKDAFVPVAAYTLPAPTDKLKDGVTDTVVDFAPTTAKIVKVIVNTTETIPDWHGAKGLKAHMFIGEIGID